MKTPYFIYKEEKLKKNIAEKIKFLKNFDPKILKEIISTPSLLCNEIKNRSKSDIHINNLRADHAILLRVLICSA
jgi:hypothetical protein